jgi:2-polyprenyl-3-methyl-5-hydroxy-6-metoxy-1,4-benzoquinol methylase
MAEATEKIRCCVCGGDDTEPFLDMAGFQYERCVECGLVYQNPRPVFGDLRKRYSDDYFRYEFDNQENFFTLMKLGLRDIRFDTFCSNGQKGDRRFLDIGCATGLLLNHMKKLGWEARGVEICKPSVEYARREFGLDVFLGTLEEASFPDGCFDVVHFSHVIEHVPEPKEMLLEVRRVLKDDGHVIVTTPNVTGWHARFTGRNWRSAIPDHVHLFSIRTLRALLENTGYRVTKQVSWGGIPVGKRSAILKKPADRLAKLFNVGDVMLFHCRPELSGG